MCQFCESSCLEEAFTTDLETALFVRGRWSNPRQWSSPPPALNRLTTDTILAKSTTAPENGLGLAQSSTTVIRGTKGADFLRGRTQNETLLGVEGNDTLQGIGGNDFLKGGSGNDVLLGGAGRDTLEGGNGLDTLSGGGGRDSFSFQRPNQGADNINDFNSGIDRILIKDAGFGLGFTSKTLANARFKVGPTATTGSQRFIYHRATGNLFFDSDGSGPANKVKIAKLKPNTRLTAQDIILETAETPPPPNPTVDTDFNIELVFGDASLSSQQKQIFRQTAKRWESVITGDLPDVTFEGKRIDDLKITISSAAIDGPGNILGGATPTQVRVESILPAVGVLTIDRADINTLEANGMLDEFALHEMGHVLGIGSLWGEFNLLAGQGTNNPLYTGQRAVTQYNRLFNRNATGIPVENTGPVGTRDAHWRESVFGNELMTGYLDANSVLSRITIASLADLGYSVNLNAADRFVA